MQREDNKFIIFESNNILEFFIRNFDKSKIFNFINNIFINENKVFSIYICSRDLIKEYNEKFRGIDKETDVLSFEYKSESKYERKYKKIRYKNKIMEYIGDILICPQHILEKALKNNENKDELFAYMVAHSYLHLLGLNHTTEDEYINIEKEAENLLNNYY